MKLERIPLVAIFVLSLAAVGLSQNPSPTPVPEDDDVVKISTSIIQLDVTVRDKKGRPITDLRGDEIEIFENGKKQDINGLSFVANVKETESAGPPVPGAPPRPVRPEEVRRTIAIVVDDLTLSFDSTFRVRTVLGKFIERRRATAI